MSDETVSNQPDDQNLVEDAIADDAVAARRGQVGPLGIAAAIVFGLFYAYALWSALSQLIDLPSDEKGIAAVGLFVPIVTYVLAFVIGRRRNVGDKALIYLAGLAVVAALGLSIIGFENYALLAGR
jgi:hypothetical protein